MDAERTAFFCLLPQDRQPARLNNQTRRRCKLHRNDWTAPLQKQTSHEAHSRGGSAFTRIPDRPRVGVARVTANAKKSRLLRHGDCTARPKTRRPHKRIATLGLATPKPPFTDTTPRNRKDGCEGEELRYHTRTLARRPNITTANSTVSLPTLKQQRLKKSFGVYAEEAPHRTNECVSETDANSTRRVRTVITGQPIRHR